MRKKDIKVDSQEPKSKEQHVTTEASGRRCVGEEDTLRLLIASLQPTASSPVSPFVFFCTSPN